MEPTIHDYDFVPMQVLEYGIRIHTLDSKRAALFLESPYGAYGFELNAPLARSLAQDLNKWATIAEATGGS